MIALIVILTLGWALSAIMALCGKQKLKISFKPIDLEKLGKKGK